MVKIVKRLKENKGLTLIEIIVAFAILAVLIGTFYGLFANSFKSVVNSGQRTKARNLASQSLENRIPSGAATEDSHVVIRFSGVADITVYGQTITTSAAVNGQEVTLTMFLPK